MQFTEGTSFHASLGRTGMKKRASFEIFVRQIRTTVRKWERWEACTYILIPEMLTVAAVLETQDNAMTS